MFSRVLQWSALGLKFGSGRKYLFHVMAKGPTKVLLFTFLSTATQSVPYGSLSGRLAVFPRSLIIGIHHSKRSLSPREGSPPPQSPPPLPRISKNKTSPPIKKSVQVKKARHFLGGKGYTQKHRLQMQRTVWATSRFSFSFRPETIKHLVGEREINHRMIYCSSRL